ncbi:MAG TPA: glycosyltransferase [Byssovorax sp.]|jgi:cellulose synthase/poly-beta-1,6-N-acetylglucosamine synthase-like glycosyltransferase
MLTLICVPYFTVLVGLSLLGLHRLFLVILCARHGERTEAARLAPRLGDDVPRVTVQLPLFNEATVAARLIEACAAFDYPHDRLEIQVLDDSNDDTQWIARAEVERQRARGVDAVYVPRAERVGYKAGALAHGLTTAKGELVAIFDADFVPRPGFLRDVVGHFDDPVVGMVQTRWGHLNRGASALTEVEALMLDGHHLVENRARFGAGYFFNFSGTGGVWRREAIERAGGWSHETLTEDLDLSYRAQLAGYRFVYRGDVVSPAEVPEELTAARAQQFRWAKGTVQTAKKLLGRLLFREPRLSISQRVEALFHLTPHFAYPLMLALSVLLLPALVLIPAGDAATMLLVDLPLCAATTTSLAAFYMLAESAQGRPRVGALLRVPLIVALGAGFAPHLARAVWEGVTSSAGEFVRTPKHGGARRRYRVAAALPYVEGALALLSLATVVASVSTGHWFATPFAALFTFGYAYVAALVLREETARRRDAAPPFALQADRGLGSGPAAAAPSGR